MEADIEWLAKCVKLQECGCKEDEKRTSLQIEFSRIFKNELSEKFYDLEHQLLNCTEKYNYAKFWQYWYQNIVSGKKFNLPQIQTTESLRCPSCGKALFKKWNLERHLRTCKPVSFRCPSCGKVLLKKWNLQRHLKTCKLFTKNNTCAKVEKYSNQ